MAILDEQNCITTVAGLKEAEWDDLQFPQGVPGGKRACIRKAFLKLTGQEPGEVRGSAVQAAPAHEATFAKALQDLAACQAASETRASSNNDKLTAALTLFAEGKKEEVVSVELETALKSKSASLAELFPSSTWPETTAVRPFPPPQCSARPMIIGRVRVCRWMSWRLRSRS